MVLYGKGTDMNRMLQITVLLLLAAGMALGAEAKSATLLLQEGIYAEETEGNLDKAIGIYQEAAKSAAVTEKAAAEATFRTGICYLKKGDKAAAEKQFKTVMDKYSSRTELATQAQTQLDSLHPSQTLHLPNEVMEYLGQLHAKTYSQGTAMKIVPNSHIYAIDEKFNLRMGGLTTYKNETSSVIAGEMSIGITSLPDYDCYNEQGEKVKTRFARSTSTLGAYDVFVTPDRPIEVNEVRSGSWIGRTAKKLTGDISGNYSLTMQNQLNVEGLEDFFLVVPKDTVIAKKSAEPISKNTVAGFDIYQWQKHVYKTTNNRVTVQFASSLATVPEKPMQLQPAPWTDGEICKLVLKTKSDMTIGATYYMPHLVKEGGKDLWQLDSFLFVTVQESRQFTRVQADIATMAPIAGRTINQLGDFVAAYEPDKVTLSSTIKGKTNTRDITVSGPVFDNEEAIMLIRRLPLAEGYSTTFQIFTVQGGQSVDCQINVDGKEDVTVPFGTVPCWKVKLAVYSGMVKALEHTLWFSADEKKLMMKYDSGAAVMELTEVSKVQPQTVVSDSKTGISITLPAGWVACTDGATNDRRLSWPIATDELETWCNFIAQEAPSSSDLNTAVDGDITILKGFFKEYTLRSDSRKSLSIDGMPAMAYTADYTNDGKAMVEYRTYIMGKSRIYWFIFRVEKDKFEANQAIYDGIVGSFAVAGK
jgi:hypothetical protein